MLTLLSFSVKGFKGFKDKIHFDLTYKTTQSTEVLRKVIILGKNGSGKTNLGKAIYDLCYNMFDRYSRAKSELYSYAGSSVPVEFRYEFLDDYTGSSFAYEYRVIDGKTVGEKITSIGGDELPEEKVMEFKNRIKDFAYHLKILNAPPFVDRGELKYHTSDETFIKAFNNLLSKGFKVNKEILVVGNRLYLREADVTLPFFECAGDYLIGLFLLLESVWAPDGIGPNLYSTLFVDDFLFFDTAEMTNQIIDILEGLSNQLIITSSNSRFFNIGCPKENLYVIGDGKIRAIQEATPKNLEGAHDFEKLYRGGTFEE